MNELFEKLKNSANSLTLNTTLITMVLYILGYLSVRFHLTAMGIGTDLAILDERYLFTGARFIIYLVTTIPSLLFLVIVFCSILYLPIFILPKSVRQTVTSWLGRCWLATKTWWSQPDRMVLFAIIFSVFVIQFFMRQSFFVTNLLVASDFSGIPEFLRFLLLQENSHLLTLFFMLLVASWVISCALYALCLKIKLKNDFTGMLQGLLGCLVLIQFLMLPVIYGTLIVDKSMPRVNIPGIIKDLAEGEEAWLVWEGSKGITYLVWNREKKTRVLVTIPNTGIKSIEIGGYDSVLSMMLKQSYSSEK